MGYECAYLIGKAKAEYTAGIAPPDFLAENPNGKTLTEGLEGNPNGIF